MQYRKLRMKDRLTTAFRERYAKNSNSQSRLRHEARRAFQSVILTLQ